MGKIREYFKLLHATLAYNEKLNRLTSKQMLIAETIFSQRLQPTNGFFVPRPSDFVAPVDWCATDPCAITVFRNGGVDMWDDHLINLGNSDDTKTFYCPYFKTDSACQVKFCQYRDKNNEYMKLTNEIATTKKLYDDAVTLRKATWKQIFSHKSK